MAQLTDKQIDAMEKNALALRNMADKQLEYIGQLRTARTSAKKENTISREADLLTRVISGQRKKKPLKRA